MKIEELKNIEKEKAKQETYQRRKQKERQGK